MGKLTKNYIYNVSYQIMVIITPIFTAPYLARRLGAVNLGTHAYVFSIVSFLSFLSLDMGYFAGRQIAYSKDSKEKLNEAFSELFTDRIVLAIFSSIVYLTIAFLYKEFTIYLLIYFIHYLGNICDISWLFIGMEDMRVYVRRNFIVKTLTILGIFLIIKNENDLIKYIAIESVSTLIANLSVVFSARKYIDKVYLNFNNLFSNILSAAWLFMPTLAQKVYNVTDKLMIKHLIEDISEVSFYEYSIKLIAIPLALITALSAVVMPRLANEFANKRTENIKKLLGLSLQFSLFFAIPLSFGLVLISKKFIPWYLGNEYLPVIYGIIVMAPITIANILRAVSGGQYLTAVKQTGIILVSEIVSIFVNIVINAMLIPRLGYYGASVSTVVTSFGVAIVQMIYLFRSVKLEGIFTYFTKYMIFSFIYFILVYVITVNMNAKVSTTLIQIALSVLIYFALNFITKDDIATIILQRIRNVLKK